MFVRKLENYFWKVKSNRFEVLNMFLKSKIKFIFSEYWVKFDKVLGFSLLSNGKAGLIGLKRNWLNNLKNDWKQFFFVKIKLRGLGFRMQPIGSYLWRLFVGLNHYFYIHMPLSIFFKKKGRKVIFFSYDLERLGIFISGVLSLFPLLIYFKGSKARGFFQSRFVRYRKKLVKFSY